MKKTLLLCAIATFQLYSAADYIQHARELIRSNDRNSIMRYVNEFPAQRGSRANTLAQLYDELGNLEAAKEFYEMAADRENYTAAHNLGVMYKDEGDIDMARYYLEKAMPLSPTPGHREVTEAELKKL